MRRNRTQVNQHLRTRQTRLKKRKSLYDAAVIERIFKHTGVMPRQCQWTPLPAAP